MRILVDPENNQIVAASPDRWERVNEIFHQALEKSADERTRWVDAACAGDRELHSEVHSLLASDQAAHGCFVDAKVRQAILEMHDERPSSMEGRQIGAYRLIRQIGRGGMGAVYLAARTDEQYESHVAIKLVQPGLDTDFILKRFRRERQILAHLEHPNISRMFDGGTTEDGIPYLVMEYIDGSWITNYTAEHNLSLEDRIRLFLPVCDAVSYAHRNFIVHRDLKPGNILIDRMGSPKLLDFGISKLLHTDREPMNTEVGGMMTPDYASPEQILSEPVTIASDVYSLGAVLYELLTGVRAHQIDKYTPLRVERAICLEPAVPPSAAVEDRSVSRRLKGDLDNIVLRALQKEPERRYTSVEHLAGDLRRYLERRPVLARPDSLAYRAGKFVQRNRLAVALASLTGAAILTGSAVAIEEARIAHERFEDVRKLASTFVFDVDAAARDVPGATRIRQLITRTGLEYLNRLAANSARDWALKRELAAAYRRIAMVQGGKTTSNLDEPGAALASLTSAGKILDEILHHAPTDRQSVLDRLSVYSEMADLQRDLAKTQDSAVTARAGLKLARTYAAFSPADLDVAQYAGVLHLGLARAAQLQGDLSAAQAELAAGAPLLDQVAKVRPEKREAQINYSLLLARQGSLQLHLGQTQDALASFRRQASVLNALCGRFPDDLRARHELMLAYSHIGDVLGNPEYENLGDPAGALEAYQNMAATARFLHDTDPADARAAMDYGIALLRLALVTSESISKHDTLTLSHKLLTAVVQRNPKNMIAVSYKTWADSELAALYLAERDRPAGVRYYRMALDTAEAGLRVASDPSTQKGLIIAVRGLAVEQARNGDRGDALATLKVGLGMAQELDRSTPLTSSLRANVARGWQVAGSVYGILSRLENGSQAIEDRAIARSWNQRAIDEWQTMEQHKTLTPAMRKEFYAARQALKELP